MAETKPRYDTIERDYRNLLGAAQSTQEREAPMLYTITTMPASSQALFQRRDALFIALAIALGAMLAIVTVLLRPQQKNIVAN